MFALLALVVAAVAWAFQVLGDGLDNPWAWLFAVLALLAAHAATSGGDLWPPKLRR
jgi:hypothetical protein